MGLVRVLRGEIGRERVIHLTIPRLLTEIPRVQAKAKLVQAVVRRRRRVISTRVLVAGSAREALALSDEHRDELRLVITDVIMPEMTGQDLFQRLAPRVPNLECLFMSGHTADIIATRGVLEADVDFLQKPFLPDDLATKVRGLLAQRG